MEYSVKIVSDMGNLVFQYEQETPIVIRKYVWSKINKIYETSFQNYRFYVLKPGLKNEWVYNYKGDSIKITFDLDADQGEEKCKVGLPKTIIKKNGNEFFVY